MTGAQLVAHQTRYELMSFWRNREGRFFTFLLPIIFLLIFGTVFGSDDVEVDGHTINQTTYYVPNLMAMAIVSAALQNLATAVVAQREAGILKRRRATPVPTWALIGGRALTSIVVAYVSLAVLALVGLVAYGAEIPWSNLPAVLVTVGLGAAAFCCLGFAFATFVRTEEGAAPALQATVLPLYFISGVFIPSEAIPDGLLAVADLFPIRHLAQALLIAYDPATTGSAFAPGHLAVIAVWGVAGLLVAARRFRWTPQGR